MHDVHWPISCSCEPAASGERNDLIRNHPGFVIMHVQCGMQIRKYILCSPNNLYSSIVGMNRNPAANEMAKKRGQRQLMVNPAAACDVEEGWPVHGSGHLYSVRAKLFLTIVVAPALSSKAHHCTPNLVLKMCGNVINIVIHNHGASPCLQTMRGGERRRNIEL